MYSNTFLPNSDFKYFEIKLDKKGEEIPFYNRKYGLFHGEQPLIEAMRRNYVAKGPGFTQTFLQELFFYKNIKEGIDGIHINAIIFDWTKYKQVVLSGAVIEKSEYIKKNKTAEYLNDKNWIFR